MRKASVWPKFSFQRCTKKLAWRLKGSKNYQERGATFLSVTVVVKSKGTDETNGI